MSLIQKRAYARVGLLGNPSDGYNGKVIAVILRNFWAQVSLAEWDQLEIVSSRNDDSRFSSIRDLTQDVKLHGYYGGIRLVKAAIKGFVDYCDKRNIWLHDRNFMIRYETTIPRQVGLAGSSAIVVATLRALIEFYGIEIAPRVLPSLVLSIEREELGIPAGLQDRVAQIYEGAVFMNFAVFETVDDFPCGTYEPIDPALLPPLYVAFSAQTSEPTEVFHNNLRFRFERGEPEVVQAMVAFADLAEQGKAALLARDWGAVSRLMNANFDLRRSICRIPKEQIEMVETARKTGSSAKFAGSGGAIVGTYANEETFAELQRELEKIGSLCVRVKVV